ncbi:MAG: hypothetical protein RLY97_1890 [Pseudomonadota bacterium]
MLSQAKIDLAVLLKHFQHAEADGEAQSPQQISGLFAVNIPVYRIRAALNKLESRDEAVREYDRYNEEEGLWRISREGIQTIEKALCLPNSFIARLNKNGDCWLESEEAADAILSKATRYHEDQVHPLSKNDGLAASSPTVSPIQINNNFTPTNTITNGSDAVNTVKSDSSGWWSVGIAVIGVIVAIVAILVALWVSGKI